MVRLFLFVFLSLDYPKAFFGTHKWIHYYVYFVLVWSFLFFIKLCCEKSVKKCGNM